MPSLFRLATSGLLKVFISERFVTTIVIKEQAVNDYQDFLTALPTALPLLRLMRTTSGILRKLRINSAK